MNFTLPLDLQKEKRSLDLAFRCADNAVNSAVNFIPQINGHRSRIIWDFELKWSDSRKSSFSGVYMWVENFHLENTILYVGMSGNVIARLLQHYKADSPVAMHWFWTLHKRPIEYCAKYEKTCDCLPRWYAIVCKIPPPFEYISAVEQDLIKQFDPPLNTTGRLTNTYHLQPE